MKNGKSYIHLLAGITLGYIVIRVLIGIDAFAAINVESAIITAT